VPIHDFSYGSEQQILERAAGPTTVASPGSGNVAWTTVDVSANVPPGYRVAIIRVTLAGGTSSSSYVGNSVDFRRDSGGQIIASVGVRLAVNPSTTPLVGVVGTVYVPLTADRKFDYQKTDGTNQGSAGATIELLGWM
jgi:hypothetical protein